ncbi:hypothetical protein [Sphingosinicella terrae]|uniref:hypothetical protein n=1 Tax=Sphingosinicella terrae TaxID=2172047 RepID=UPI0013B36273|nr:hypothetical protein [Sphingosinicella terrae]
MPNSRWLLVVALLIVLIGASLLVWRQNGAREAARGPQAQGPGPALPPPAEPPSAAAPPIAEAFRTVYGAPDTAEATVGENRYRVSAEAIEPLGDLLVLITRADNVDDCHACSGALGIHYLRRTSEGGLAVVGRWPGLVPGSSFGNATTGWTVRRDLAAHPVLVNEGGFTGQGITCSWANLVELDPAGPRLRGQVPLGFSNAGAIVDGSAPSELQGRIVRPVRDRSFEIDYGGSETFTERYVRRGESYTVVGDSRFPGGC